MNFYVEEIRMTEDTKHMENVQMNTLISVNESLPEKEEIVFCYDPDLNYAFFGAIMDSGEGAVWCRCADILGASVDGDEWDCWNIQNDNDYKVTHWAPLPKPLIMAEKAQAEPNSD